MQSSILVILTCQRAKRRLVIILAILICIFVGNKHNDYLVKMSY